MKTVLSFHLLMDLSPGLLIKDRVVTYGFLKFKNLVYENKKLREA